LSSGFLAKGWHNFTAVPLSALLGQFPYTQSGDVGSIRHAPAAAKTQLLMQRVKIFKNI